MGDMRAMSQGWQTTWDRLARSQNGSADDLLLRQLDANDPDVWQGAMETLLRRRSKAGPRELLRRWHSLDVAIKQLVQFGSSQFMGALRDAVVSDDDRMVENACQAACDLGEYDLISPLIHVAEDVSSTNRDLAAATVLELSEMLYEELTAPRDYAKRCDPQLIRGRLLGGLEKSVNRFRKHSRPELVAAFLCLAKRDNGTLTRLLNDPHDPAYLCHVDQLTHSSQNSVIQLSLNFLESNRLPSSVINVFSRRADMAFIEQLLDRFQGTLSKAVRANLKRIEKLPWISKDTLIENLDGPRQAAAVRLVSASGTNRSSVFKFVRRLLQHGKSQGRAAAAEVLAEYNGSEPNRLTLRSISDPSPDVQAHAVRQIRRRGIPGALTRLLEFVESPHEVVREAARSCLPEFRFDRYLASFDVLDDAVRQTTGKLVFKVDPTVRQELVKELDALARSRRLRGLQIVQAMQIVARVEDRVLELLSDDDHMVRAEAARALEWSIESATYAALQRALLDRSVAVQEAARHSLKQVSRSTAATSHRDTIQEQLV